MKQIIGIIMISLFLVLSGFQQTDKKEKKVQKQQEMSQLIKSGKFRFKAYSAHSNLFSIDHLSGDYEMTFDSLKIQSYLPYYGRAYSASYGEEGGVKFNLTADSINSVWNEKKKYYTISTELSDTKDHYSIFLTSSLDGFAELQITFRDRQWMSYSGIIEKISQ